MVSFPAGSFCFPQVDLGKRFKIHPAYIPRQATDGGSCCIWLRSVTSLERKTVGYKTRSDLVLRGQSGGRGIRTHGDVAATMVFKTIAIGH